MKSKFNIFYWSIYLSNVLITLLFYKRLPNQVVTSFDFNFQPQAYGSKTMHVFLGVVLPITLILFKFILRKIDPLKDNYIRFEKPYNYIIGSLVVLFSVLNIIFILYANKNISSIKESFSLTFGLIFIIMGNFLPQIKRNFFLGIRSPWTLSDEDTWNKTHRLGGVFFIIFGFLFIIDGLILKLNFSFIILIIGVIILYFYSFLIFPKDKKTMNKDDLKKDLKKE